jgi:preprotein translocase subunit SecE
MNDEARVQDVGTSDKVKLWLAILLVIGGIVAYYSFGSQPGWMRWLMMLGGLVLAVGAFAWSQYGRDFWQFVLESRIELRKVVWPNREETGKTTLVVFVFVIIAATFFWVLDLGLAWATRALSGQIG